MVFSTFKSSGNNNYGMAGKSADLGKIFSKAFSCGLSFKRILPFFILGFVSLLIIFASAESFIIFMKEVVASKATGIMFFSHIASIAVIILAFFVVIFLVYIYFVGGLIDNVKNYWSGKEVKFMASLKAAKPLYFSLLLATIFVGIISGILGSIPFIGFLFSIVLSWLFLVYQPSVIASGKNAVESIRESYSIFMENKLQTLLFWAVLIIVSLVFIIFALIPLILSAIPAFVMMKSAGALAAFKANILILFAGSLITVFLFCYVTVFSESAKTFYYMSVKGGSKKPRRRR